MPSYKPVTAALRVLNVLAAVNRLGSQATVGEIHRRIGIDKATIVRMLETLAYAGYLIRDPDHTVYRVTGKALSLTTGFDRHTVVGTIIAPLMAEFRQHIEWPSDVALFDLDAMLVIKSSRQGELLSFNRSPGFRAPVLGTSLGLAYMAHCPAAEREAFLKRIANDPSPWSKLLQDPVRLDKRLGEVREQGCATMDENYSRVEYDGRVGSIGVPIMTEKKLFASINVIYLKGFLTPQAARDTLLAPLQEVARKMARELEKKDTGTLL
jgi:IclR family mhp operon transcriptional activator